MVILFFIFWWFDGLLFLVFLSPQGNIRDIMMEFLIQIINRLFKDFKFLILMSAFVDKLPVVLLQVIVIFGLNLLYSRTYFFEHIVFRFYDLILVFYFMVIFWNILSFFNTCYHFRRLYSEITVLLLQISKNHF